MAGWACRLGELTGWAQEWPGVIGETLLQWAELMVLEALQLGLSRKRRDVCRVEGHSSKQPD